MTASPIVLSWVNHVDAGTFLSSSPAVGDNSLENMKDPVVGRRYRSAAATVSINLDFGDDVEIGVVAIRFPRDVPVPTGGTFQHTLLTSAAGEAWATSALPNMGADKVADGYGYHVQVLPAAVSGQYYTLYCTAKSQSELSSFLDVGRLWIGPAWSPQANIVFGYDDEWTDRSAVSVAARSGAEFVDERERQRAYAFALEALSEAERDEVRELQRIAGISGQVLFVKDPDAPAKETILGRLAISTPIRHRDLPVYAKAFTVRESL